MAMAVVLAVLSFIWVVSHVSPEVSPQVFKGCHFLKINWPVFRISGAFLSEPFYSSNNVTSECDLIIAAGRWKENQTENPNE